MLPTSELQEPDIARLVDRFYDKVRLHPTLGPVFNGAVHDWDEHKQTLTAFWCAVALGTGGYRGNPMAAHRAQPIHATHFDDWLALWAETARETLPPGPAARMLEFAGRIGQNLRRGLGLG